MHRASIWALAFSPDGRELYSGSADGLVHVWDAGSGTHLRSLRSHRRAVLDIRFDPTGREVITASRDGSIVFWSRASGTILRTLRPSGGGVFAVALTSTQIVSASHDHSIRLSPSGATLRGHTAAVTDLAIVANRLVSGSRDRTAKIWALDSPTEIATRRAHSRWITKVRAAGERAFVTVSEDGTLAMWGIEADVPRWRHQVSPYQTPVWGLDVSSDGRLAVTGDASGVPRLWDLERGVELRALASGRLAHRACAFSPDARLVAVGNDDTSLAVFEVATGTRVWRVPGAGLGVLSAVVSDDRRTIVTGHADGTVKARHVDGCATPTFAGHQRFVYQMRRLTPGRFASAAFDGTVAAWDLATGEALARCQHGGEIFALAAWNDGRRAATAGGRAVRVWNLDAGALLTTLPVRGAGAHSLVAASADGRTVVLTAETGEMDVWNIDPTGAQPRCVASLELPLATDMLSALAFAPNGATAVAATAGGAVLVVHLAGPRLHTRFACHEDWIRDLRITPDGRHIVASCQDLALSVLDLATGRVIDVGLSDTPIAAIAIAGDTLAAVDLDGGAHLVTPP